MTQTERVLDYMKRNGHIDPMSALLELGIMRLGARIWDLKAQGIQVVTEMKSRTTADGSIKRWAEYRLGESA